MEVCSERQSLVPTKNDWACCEAIARSEGRTFFLASRMLPPGRRRGVLATYAYCRTADNIVDTARATHLAALADELMRWEGQLDCPTDPVAIAFADTRARFSIPVEPVHDLIAGIRMDLTTTRYQTWEELRTYCYHVAGTVGLMVAPVLGCRDSTALVHAANLGIAMQLTNILRDIGEDSRLGRLYLPLDEVAAFGCDPEAILAGRPGKRFPELVAFQIERARALYADAQRGIRALAPSGRITTLAASRHYAGILSAIEALDYDVFRARAYVSSARKLGALPAIATSFVQLSLFSGDSAHHKAMVEKGAQPPSARPAAPTAMPFAGVGGRAVSSRSEYPSYE